MSSRAAQRFSVLAVCMKHLCAATINPFISNVESFNCRAGPCHGLCERTWRHTKLWQLGGSLLFISYPALRCLMAVRGSSPPLPLQRSQIMIRKDANGKEYNDYQAAAPKCVSKRMTRINWVWRRNAFHFSVALKKFPSTDLHPPAGSTSTHIRGSVQVFLQHSREKKVQKGRTWWVCLLLVLVYVMIDWRNIWQPRKQEKNLCCFVASHISLHLHSEAHRSDASTHSSSSKKSCGSMKIKEIMKGRLPVYGLRGKRPGGDRRTVLQGIPHIQSESGRMPIS